METRSGRVTGQASSTDRSRRQASRGSERQPAAAKRTKSRPPPSDRHTRRARSAKGAAGASGEAAAAATGNTDPAADASPARASEDPQRAPDDQQAFEDAARVNGMGEDGEGRASNAVRCLQPGRATTLRLPALRDHNGVWARFVGACARTRRRCPCCAVCAHRRCARARAHWGALGHRCAQGDNSLSTRRKGCVHSSATVCQQAAMSTREFPRAAFAFAVRRLYTPSARAYRSVAVAVCLCLSCSIAARA